VVAGPDGWGTDAFDEAVRAARHGDRVRRLGWVPLQARHDLLAGALAAVVHDVDGIATNLRRRGPEHAASYRWDACADGLVELYRDAMAGSG
jgi:hypothetical protein